MLDQLELFQPVGYRYEQVADAYPAGSRNRLIWLGMQLGHDLDIPRGPEPAKLCHVVYCSCGWVGGTDFYPEHLAGAGIPDDGRDWFVKVNPDGSGVLGPYTNDNYVGIPSGDGFEYIPYSEIMPARCGG